MDWENRGKLHKIRLVTFYIEHNELDELDIALPQFLRIYQ